MNLLTARNCLRKMFLIILLGIRYLHKFYTCSYQTRCLFVLVVTHALSFLRVIIRVFFYLIYNFFLYMAKIEHSIARIARDLYF